MRQKPKPTELVPAHLGKKPDYALEYALRRKLFKMGGSLCVSIPVWIANTKGMHEGDFVKLKFVAIPGLTIEQEEKSKKTKPKSRVHMVEHKVEAT